MAQDNITGEVPCPELFDEALATFERALYGRGMAEATVDSDGSSLRLEQRLEVGLMGVKKAQKWRWF